MPSIIKILRYLLVFLNVTTLFLIWYSIRLHYQPHERLNQSLIIHYFHFNETSQLPHFDNKLLSMDPRFLIPSSNENVFKRNESDVFPTKGVELSDDRIYNQIRHVPQHYSSNKIAIKDKLILLYTGKHSVHFGDFDLCLVTKCKISVNIEDASSADVIIWITTISPPSHKRPSHQIWGVLYHESPMHTFSMESFEQKAKSMINWTLTYRSDSTIPFPYYKYSPYDLINTPPERYPIPKKNYAFGKTKLVGWMVSNCKASNDRLNVAKELQKYIEVDIYGTCGTLKCSKLNFKSCLEEFNKTYKFVLSFENSNCRHYITEKFYLNGLSQNVIPIVLGAHPDDYKRVAPPHSYIHVDDFNSIYDLAQYLKYLDKNDTAFNEYFAWKDFGTVLFQHHLYCRICMMAHEADRVKSYYANIQKWWRGDGNSICLKSGKWN